MSFAPRRGDGPLGKLQREGDILKSKIDEVAAITTKWTPKSANDPEVISAHKNCVSYKIEASSLLLRASNLQKHDEMNAVSDFDQKKTDEIRRLEIFQTRLNKLIKALEDLEGGKELRNTRESELGENDKGDSGENLSDDDDDHDYDDDDDVTEDKENMTYIATHPFAKQQDSDLGLEVDEILEIIEKRKDGWWKAKNADGQVGLVPSNHLEPYDEDDSEEEDDGDLDDTSVQEVVEDESESAPAPSADVHPPEVEEEKSEEKKSPRSGKVLWKGVQDMVAETKKTDVTDVLAAMGALPAGFRPSTLHSKLMEGGGLYKLSNAVKPKMTESRLAFTDLHLDPATSQIRKTATRVLRTCRLVKCRMIPAPGTGVEVLSQHVRVCLFDGSKVLSNIETVRASVEPAKPKQWIFSPRQSANSASGLAASSLGDGNLVARTSTGHSNIGLLFELGVTYIRNQTGEQGELSCGWIHLKLFDEQGNPIPNKTYDMPLNGGTPYEQGVDVDPSILRRASSSRFRSLLAANKQPAITLQIGTPSEQKRKYLEFLPETVVVRSRFAELVAYYRRVLVDALVRDRLAPLDADLVHSPVIAAFNQAVDQPDVMDAMQSVWEEKKRPLTRADKRDKENLKNVFKSVVMETAFPLVHVTNMPMQKWADPQNDMTRAQVIHQTLQVTKQDSGVLRHLLAPSGEIEPFDISEVTFDPLRDYGRSLS